jgi:hypothetical protein
MQIGWLFLIAALFSSGGYCEAEPFNAYRYPSYPSLRTQTELEAEFEAMLGEYTKMKVIFGGAGVLTTIQTAFLVHGALFAPSSPTGYTTAALAVLSAAATAYAFHFVGKERSEMVSSVENRLRLLTPTEYANLPRDMVLRLDSVSAECRNLLSKLHIEEFLR